MLGRMARAVRQGQSDEAIALLQALTAGGSGGAERWHDLAVLLYEQGDLVGAEAVWQEALRRTPRLEPALLGLAQMMDVNGRRAEARALLAGDAAAPPTGLVAERLGAMLLADGDPAGAEAVLRASLLAGGASDASWYALGDALRTQGKRAEAIEVGRQIVEQRAGQAVPLAWLGVALLEAGEHEEAEACLRQALAAPHAPAWARIRHAEALLKLGQAEECVAAARAALAAEPGQPPLMAHAGYLLRRAGAEADAVALFAEATERDPMSEAVRLLESASFYDSKRLDEAAESARQAALVLFDRSDIMDRYGHLLLDLEDHDTAAECFTTAIALSEHHVRAWVGLCEAERRRKRIKEAVAAFRKVVELNADANTVRYLRYRLFGETD